MLEDCNKLENYNRNNDQQRIAWNEISNQKTIDAQFFDAQFST